jgi:predicted Zn-dependent protease
MTMKRAVVAERLSRTDLAFHRQFTLWNVTTLSRCKIYTTSVFVLVHLSSFVSVFTFWDTPVRLLPNHAMDQELLAPWAAPHMREGIFRKGLRALLISCGLIVICSYALMSYLEVRRNYPADLSNGSPVTRATSVQFLIDTAQKELAGGQVEQALVNFREALSLNPESIGAQLGLAEGEYAAGREAVAAKEFGRALQLDNENRFALLALARIHSHHAHTWPQAALDYQNYLKQNPSDAQAQLELARVLTWQGKPAEAATLFERSHVAPLMTDADGRDYAFALIKTRRDARAVAVLRTLLAQRPGDSELSLQLVDIYANHRNWSATLPIYRDLLAQRPGDPSLNLKYGLSLVATGHYQAALEPLDKARTAMPTNGEAGLAYARAMKGTGDLKRALKEYEKVLPQFERDTSVVREYADVLLEKKDYQKSARYYGVAYRQGLQDDRLLAGYAGSLSGAGKYKEAVPYLEKLYRRNSTPRVALELARVLAWQGKAAESATLFERSDVMPLMTDADRRDYVFALAATRNWGAALPIYRDLLAKRPGDPSLNLSYGLSLLASGHYQAALEPLDKARTAMPANREAGLAYARAVKGTGDLKNAVKEYEKVLPRFEGDTSVVREYADALLEEKDYQKSAQYYGVAYSQGLEDDRLLAGYADSLKGAGKNKEALPYLEELYRRNRPGDPSINLSYGLDLLAAGQYQAALAPLDKARTALPTNGEAGLAYARAMKGTGNLKRAVKEYEKVLPRFEGDTSVVREYADVLLEEKDYQKSARYYGIAYRQGLRDDRLLAGYAGSLNGAGKYKEALPYLEELYRRNPTPRVTLELAKLLHRLGRNDRAKELVNQLETASPQLARSPEF